MSVFSGPEIVTNGLVLNLDAANIKSYPGSGTVWTDLSPTNSVSSLVNGPTFLSSNNGVINFDGVDDYASVSGTTGNTSLSSVECWISFNVITVGATHQIVARTNTSVGTFNLIKNNLNEKIQFAVRLAASPATQSNIFSDAIMVINTWYHLVGTYDGSFQKLYVNSILQSTVTSLSGTLDTAGTYALNIGRNTSNAAFTNARIPLVRLYNRALSSAEVSQNFEALRGRYGV